MRPEHRLLLACAHTRLSDAAKARIRRLLLREEIDWPFLAERARYHGLTPLLYRSLYRTAPEAVPAKTLSRLRAEVHANAMQVRLHTRELLTLLRLLAAHGIAALPLKGPVLAAYAYGEAALRVAGDLDVLLRRHDIPDARALLIERGYRTHVPPKEEAGYLATQLGYEFVRGQTVVELHWSFLPRTLSFRLDPEAAWARAETVEVAGTPVRMLAYEDRLLFLCAHGAKHGWERLKWICDVAALLRKRPALSGERLLHRARRTGSRRMLLLGCSLAAALLQAPLPPALAERLQTDAAVARLRTRVERQLFEVEAPLSAPQRDLFLLAARERWRDRLPYVRHVARLAAAPSERDRRFLVLPSRLRAFYYLVRPVRVLRAYGAGAFRRVTRRIRKLFSSGR